MAGKQEGEADLGEKMKSEEKKEEEKKLRS